MIIEKRNLKKFINRKINNCEQDLDVGTLMHIFDWIREYKPKKITKCKIEQIHNIDLKLTKGAHEQLIYMKKLLKLDTITDVIRASISLTKFLAENTNKGDKIILESKNGKCCQVLFNVKK